MTITVQKVEDFKVFLLFLNKKTLTDIKTINLPSVLAYRFLLGFNLIYEVI